MRTGGSSGPRAVFNSSPLIVLAKLGLLRQALKLSCEVEIPEAVPGEGSQGSGIRCMRGLTGLLARV